MEPYKLFDAEYRFMSIVWELEPVNSTQLCRVCQERLGWKKPTTYTVLRKLGDRRIVRNENAVVTALVKREQVQQYESQTLVEKAFDGSLPGFLTAFLGKQKLSREEAEELKRIIEEATETCP
ncbi:BlaI/MecI/CopY family transcriptional regulator [Angelakisella massiliensis]|uniref:BlaI/MecI/CopY family transcriptional regulator n=2 Tax=Angelakisella massiliensis TaxID=1871018 RepID=UPI0024B0B290|nr:BlaI/MecI/CopY family transcriptional regulator [Angelakisella massiliensis]